jgi:hypothetical protein
MSPLDAKAVLPDEETVRVVELIRPSFDEYVSKYDERKYPPGIYENLLRAFGTDHKVSDDDIRTALLWKFGHLAKRRIPSSHEALISHLQEQWRELSSATLASTVEAFDRFAAVEGPRRYITVTFLLHLLRPAEVPIIDQHNFRAMNCYFSKVRPGWHGKSKPSSYADLETLSSFLRAVRACWKRIEPSSVPCQRHLDRFLMMYGRALKWQKRTTPKIPPKARGAPESEPSCGTRDSDVGCSIRLPHGGAGATFDLNTLIQHLNESGRPYIIQGQTQCVFSAHPKRQSLDYWLRQTFVKNHDTKQAVNYVISQLVSTGLFEAGAFQCPDSGRLCKGIRIVEARSRPDTVDP